MVVVGGVGVALAETGKLRAGDCGVESPKDRMETKLQVEGPVSSESPHRVAFPRPYKCLCEPKGVQFAAWSFKILA